MSLIFAEGFENYGTSGRPNFYKYSANSNAIHNQLTTGRFHGYGWRMGATWQGGFDELYTHHIASTGNTAFYMGFAIRKRATNGMTGGYSRFLMAFLDSANATQMTVNFNSSNESIIEVRDGGNTLRDSGTFITDTAWHFMEVGCYVHASSGWYEVRLDGSQVCRFDGDTEYTAAGDITKVRLRAPFNYSTWSIDVDDWYVCDGTGTSNNSFLGDISVETLIPTSDGTEGDMTPSTGSDSYAVVDEEPPNGTDYILADTPGQRETFNCSDLSYINREVVGVYVEYTSKNDGLVDNELKSVTRADDTTYDGSTSGHTIPVGQVSYMTVGQAFDNNPSTTSAWTVAQVNAAEFGVKLQS